MPLNFTPLWDLDETLVSTEKYLDDSLFTALNEEQLQIDRATFTQHRVNGLGLAEIVALLHGDEKKARMVSETRGNIYAALIPKHVEWTTGAEELLEKINGEPTGIATRGARRFFDIIDQKLGISRFVPVVVTGDDVTQWKPHPEALLKAANALNVVPSTCLYIGDHPDDILTAHAAGMKSCLYTNEWVPTLTKEPPTFTIYWMKDMEKILGIS